MKPARKRSEELVDEAREDANLLRYLANEVVARGAPARDPFLDIEVTQRALLSGYAALLRHAHNLEHVNAIWDRMVDE